MSNFIKMTTSSSKFHLQTFDPVVLFLSISLLPHWLRQPTQTDPQLLLYKLLNPQLEVWNTTQYPFFLSYLSLSIASFIHHPRSDQPGKKSKWQNLQSKSTPPRPLDGQQLTHLESSLPSNSPEGLRIFHLVLLYRK